MIKSERLALVEFDVKYANDLYDVWSDFEVIKYTYMPLMKSVAECSAMIERQISRTDKVFTDRFVILLNNKAIGIAGCAVMDKENCTFGLYYQFGQQYWGHGYASECANAIVKYVFHHYPEATIKADAVSINTASLSVLRKAGFKQIDISKNGFTNNGFNLDLVNFEISNLSK